MSLATLTNLACTITPRTVEADDEGEVDPVDGEPIELDGGPDGGCYAEPQISSEGTDRAHRQTDTWRIVLRPADTSVTGHDLIAIPELGFVGEVIGPPRRFVSPRLRGVHHIELDARRVKG